MKMQVSMLSLLFVMLCALPACGDSAHVSTLKSPPVQNLRFNFTGADGHGKYSSEIGQASGNNVHWRGSDAPGWLVMGPYIRLDAATNSGIGQIHGEIDVNMFQPAHPEWTYQDTSLHLDFVSNAGQSVYDSPTIAGTSGWQTIKFNGTTWHAPDVITNLEIRVGQPHATAHKNNYVCRTMRGPEGPEQNCFTADETVPGDIDVTVGEMRIYYN